MSAPPPDPTAALRLLAAAALGAGLGGVLNALAAGFGLSAPPAAASAVGALLGLGVGLSRVFASAERSSEGAFGSARLASDAEAQRDFSDPGGLVIGRALSGTRPLLRYNGPSHLLTFAPTRSGKGVGAVIPNLLLANRSVLCIDPKGENARAARAARARFGPVHVLDPFNLLSCASAAFNPFDVRPVDEDDLGDWASGLAEALVQDPPGMSGEAHWNEEAKALLAGIILHVATSPYETCRTLPRVRALLASEKAAFTDLLEAMQCNPSADDLVRRAANRHLSKNDREAPSVLSTALRHTHFLDGPRLRRTMEHTDFRFEDLAQGTVSVFLVLPPERLATHARWLRLLVSEALRALARDGVRAAGRPPVLLLLDEFAALGRLDAVQQAFGLMAGYGVQLWPILQDLHQLRAVYGRAAGGFLSNAGVLQIFNVADLETADYVSKSLGTTTRRFETQGASAQTSRPFRSDSRSRQETFVRRDLLTPDEVMRLSSDELLLLTPGRPAVRARKVRYFEDPEFQGQSAVSPSR